MRVAWTGHRPELFEDPVAARAAVEEAACDLVQDKAVARFVVGGQRGVDTWAAQSALRLGVSLTLILPLQPTDFASGWAGEDRQALETIVANAHEVRVVGGDPHAAFRERNRLLVANADLLVAVWSGRSGGGTSETIAFARTNATPLREILLTPSAGASQARGHGL